MRKVLYIMGFLSDEDIDWMASSGRVIRPEKNAAIIVEGEAAGHVFFVLGGECSVEIAGAGVIAQLRTGEVIGEMSYVDNALPSATVRSGLGCALLAIDRRDIDDRLASDPGFAGRFYKAMAIFLVDRLRAANRRGVNLQGAVENDQDELGDMLMDSLSVAGLRFEHMLRKLSGTS